MPGGRSVISAPAPRRKPTNRIAPREIMASRQSPDATGSIIRFRAPMVWVMLFGPPAPMRHLWAAGLALRCVPNLRSL
jgi:hypothetical protein